jgi:hypothetical protein
MISDPTEVTPAEDCLSDGDVREKAYEITSLAEGIRHIARTAKLGDYDAAVRAVVSIQAIVGAVDRAATSITNEMDSRKTLRPQGRPDRSTASTATNESEEDELDLLDAVDRLSDVRTLLRAAILAAAALEGVAHRTNDDGAALLALLREVEDRLSDVRNSLDAARLQDRR